MIGDNLSSHARVGTVWSVPDENLWFVGALLGHAEKCTGGSSGDSLPRDAAGLHGRAENAAQIDEFRRCTYAGRPFGDEVFVLEMEARFQRKWLRPERRNAEFAKSA